MVYLIIRIDNKAAKINCKDWFVMRFDIFKPIVVPNHSPTATGATKDGVK